jgi:hypothetical protein
VVRTAVEALIAPLLFGCITGAALILIGGIVRLMWRRT